MPPRINLQERRRQQCSVMIPQLHFYKHFSQQRRWMAVCLRPSSLPWRLERGCTCESGFRDAARVIAQMRTGSKDSLTSSSCRHPLGHTCHLWGPHSQVCRHMCTPGFKSSQRQNRLDVRTTQGWDLIAGPLWGLRI